MIKVNTKKKQPLLRLFLLTEYSFVGEVSYGVLVELLVARKGVGEENDCNIIFGVEHSVSACGAVPSEFTDRRG